MIPLALFALLFPEKLVDAVMAEIERMTNLSLPKPKTAEALANRFVRSMSDLCRWI